MKFSFRAGVLLAAFFVGCSIIIFGCNPSHTPTITIEGSPRDIVIVKMISGQTQPACCSTGSANTFCQRTAAITIGFSGVGFHDRMGDNANYSGAGFVSGCSTDSFFLSGCGDVTASCFVSSAGGGGGGGPTGDPCLGGGGGFSPGDNPIGPECSPIVIDTAGEGFELTSAQDGVLFDIRAVGQRVHIAWTARGSKNAFLALDRNGNGTIDNGAELFGNFTPQSPSANPNGFLALAEFDKPENGGNGDGIIDAHDTVFNRLLLWIDENHDGISQPEELHHLVDLGIASLSLNYKESRKTDEFGNVFRYRAKVNPESKGDQSEAGRWGYDVFLTTVEVPPKKRGSQAASSSGGFSQLRCRANRVMARLRGELRN